MYTSRLLCCALFLSVAAQAGEKKVMHCFAWTPVKTATPADWDAFYKASEDLPKKIKGLTKIWYGKLAAPLSQTTVAKIDPEARKKMVAGENVAAEIGRTTRDYGMCMEFASPDALKAYDADPYHKVWTDAYAKVRVEGTTTFNILGQ
jgi:Stress responsive A/B Barrel Domain